VGARVEEAVQLSRQCRVKVQSGQLTRGDKMRFQPGFPGMFSPWRWLGGQEHGLKCLRDTTSRGLPR
jgi:hypothetical protein